MTLRLYIAICVWYNDRELLVQLNQVSVLFCFVYVCQKMSSTCIMLNCRFRKNHFVSILKCYDIYYPIIKLIHILELKKLSGLYLLNCRFNK